MKKLFVAISVLSFLALVAGASLFFPAHGRAADQGGVSVGVTVTNCGNGIIDAGETCDNGGSNGACGAACSTSCTINSGPTTGDTSGPAIALVASSVSGNTFFIKWSLSDSSDVRTTSFSYGVGNYSSSTVATALGSDIYEVNLAGLVANTNYQYKIAAEDSLSNASSLTGVFSTANIAADTPPQILAINSVVGFTTTTISWSATDDNSISVVNFMYGTSGSYGSVGAVVGSYDVNLSGLSMSTIYYYKISVTDGIGQTTSSTGSFTTLGADLIPPAISNVSSAPGVTTAEITFNTNELATVEVLYGSTNSYGSTFTGGTPAGMTHSVILPNLLPNHTYYFKIVATDNSNNSGSTDDLTFKTLSDVVPPPNVLNFQLTTTSNSIILNWVNPSLLVAPDFSGVKIVRGTNSQTTGPNDPVASLTHTTSGQTFTDTNIVFDTNYYYTIYSFDTSNNYSSGSDYKVGRIFSVLPTPAEICGNNIDDDRDSKIDCADPDCSVQCQPVAVEICGNNLDDDSDGKADCLDSDCVAFPECINVPGAVAVCNNGLDDDSDGKIDFPNDSGCSSLEDNDEYNPPETTIPEFAKIDFSKLIFSVGNRQINLIPRDKIVTSLVGSGVSVGVPLAALNGRPQSLLLRVGGQNYQFSFSSSSETYFSDFTVSATGKNEAYLEIDYGLEQKESILFYLTGLAKGTVTGGGDFLFGAEVSLLEEGGNKIYLGVYGEQNPLLTDQNGIYGWVVQNGKYYLTAKKEGFYERITPVFTVDNNVVNINIDLIKQPLKLLEVIDANLSVGENTIRVAKNLLDKTSAISQVSIQKINDVADNPVVEKTATEIVAPTVVGVAAVGTVAVVSWVEMLSLLRFLFLQPLLLLGKRKREKWGSVYNSLTKLPIDLAIVRLFNAETNRLVQTKVTDGKGRYAFIVDKGKYRLEAQKANLIFPSMLLKGFKDDGETTDIYHGEVIEVTEKNSLITANIPLDPAGETRTPARIRREKAWRRLQTGLSGLGFLVTVVSLYISPVWYMWVLLAVHLFFLVVFRRITKPKRAKGWGIVYDSVANTPVSRVVARLFDSQFNKLVATEFTDRNGRYHFLAGGNKYYVTYEHKDYEPTKLEISGSTKKDSGAITVDVKIKKKGGNVV